MQTFFENARRRIMGYSERYFTRVEKEFQSVSPPWTHDVLQRIRVFMGRGKMIRGGLVTLGYRMYKKGRGRDVIAAATAIELLHSSLLVHDDIMDRDRTRRGKMTLFAQYEELGKKQGLNDYQQFGLSCGICVGDVGFFLAADILSGLSVSNERQKRILKLFTREVTKVGIAQLVEMRFGLGDDTPKPEEVLAIYKNKTAHYTFSVPLIVGAELAGAKPSDLRKLDRLGEHLGLLFQIRDDELGLYGSEKTIGKPIGSDITEGKKTLYYVLLHERATALQKKKLKTIFGRPRLSKKDFEYILELLDAHGVREDVDELKHSFARKAHRLLQTMSLASRDHKLIKHLIAYNLHREK